MSLFYHRRLIDLGPRPQRHGHVVYVHAFYRQNNCDAIPIVYKENKHEQAELSGFEVAFGELARLFLAPNLTPPQVLVKNEDNNVVGVACEHVSYMIARRHILPNAFYSLQQIQDETKLLRLDVNDPKRIPYYFLNDFYPGFFHTLTQSAKRGAITLDVESLAQILTGSYSLEEDDLHKGNLGFYVVEENNQPRVVFFKIDHDLMLADSVMSHVHSRFVNWLQGSEAFDITKRDLIHFPSLTDSQNFYWPTVKRPIFGCGNKAYNSDKEVQAFADLADSEEFRRIKWQAFYRHVLIPPTLIQQLLSIHLDDNDPALRAEIALITQSVVARQAKLRAVLFSIPEFRDVVYAMSEQDNQAMVASITDRVLDGKEEELKKEICSSMSRYQDLCQPGGGFVHGDTPLHAAIRLKDYRYYDTWQSFGQYVEKRNEQGKTPLDVAVSMAGSKPMTSDDVRSDAWCTMKHLLREGAEKTADFRQFTMDSHVNLNNYLFHSGYPTRVRKTETLAQFKELLRDLGEDHRYSLKMQKEVAVICVRQFAKHHEKNPNLSQMLRELKSDLNGSDGVAPAPELQFIRQLRSQLWIVRIIRGLLGGTATQVQLNNFIDKELKRITPLKPCCWSFFSRKEPKQIEQQESSILQEHQNSTRKRDV